jgi:hypothetical protein
MVKNKALHFTGGFFLGLATILLCVFLFIVFVAKVDFSDGWHYLNQTGIEGKVIVIGALPNILVYVYSVQKAYINFAKGILLATILAGIYTIF